jgi:hypothetical protein
MRAAAVELGRARDSDGPIGLLWAPADQRPKRALTFAESGCSFIQVRPQHLRFMATIYGREVPAFEEVEGRVLVDAEFLPLGIILVHHEPDGRHKLHAHLVKWLREYPVACLRSIKEVCDSLRARNIYELYCTADESVAGSLKLVLWLRGEPTGERELEGPVYAINLKKTPI